MFLIKKILNSIIILFIFILSSIMCSIIPISSYNTKQASAKSIMNYDLIFLSSYSKTINIGEEFKIYAIPTSGKKVTFKSSDSKIASIDSHGFIKGKKAGTIRIDATTKNGYSSAYITVRPTKVSILNHDTTIENGESVRFKATSSNNSSVTWKSSKPSIATIDKNGYVTGKKPGETIITASCDGYVSARIIKVDAPKVTLNMNRVVLYRGESAEIIPTISSKSVPTYKSNKSSVATVDKHGKIKAIKNGTAIISVKVDTVIKEVEVTVKKPTILLSSQEITLPLGQVYQMEARVSSNQGVTWSTSNPNVIMIDNNGRIQGIKKGRAYVYAWEDGTKVKCNVVITD